LPNSLGEKKLNILNYDLIHNVFADVVLFNYVEFILGNYRLGIPLDDLNPKIPLYSNPYKNFDGSRMSFI